MSDFATKFNRKVPGASLLIAFLIKVSSIKGLYRVNA